MVSHDLKLLDASITRILHVDRDQVVEYRGTYSQYRKARSEDEIRLRALAGRQEQEIRRLKTLADSMRGQTAKRARKAKTLDTRVEKLTAKKVEGPAREQRVKFRFPEPPHSGKVMLVANELTKSYGGPPVFEDISFDVGRGERLLIMGLERRGQDEPAPHPGGRSPRRITGRSAWGTASTLGYYAQEHEGIHDGVPVHRRT